MFCDRYFRNRRGISLVQVMIAAAAVGGLSLLLAKIVSDTQRSRQQAIFVQSVQQLRNNISALLKSPQAWEKTLQQDTSTHLRCLQPGAANKDCSYARNDPQTFNLVDPAGTVVVNSLTQTTGFTTNGNACTTYVATGNDTCPLRVSLTWEPLCTSTPCENPSFRVVANFTYSPSSPALKYPFNTDNYRLTQVVGSDFQSADAPPSLEDICAQLGGTVAPEGSAVPCDLSTILTSALQGLQCPSGSVLQGVTTGGQPVCVSTSQDPDPASGFSITSAKIDSKAIDDGDVDLIACHLSDQNGNVRRAPLPCTQDKKGNWRCWYDDNRQTWIFGGNQKKASGGRVCGRGVEVYTPPPE